MADAATPRRRQQRCQQTRRGAARRGLSGLSGFSGRGWQAACATRRGRSISAARASRCNCRAGTHRPIACGCADAKARQGKARQSKARRGKAIRRRRFKPHMHVRGRVRVHARREQGSPSGHGHGSRQLSKAGTACRQANATCLRALASHRHRRVSAACRTTAGPPRCRRRSFWRIAAVPR